MKGCEHARMERSLENWERWISRRKEGAGRLGTATGRSPGDLLMNQDTVWRLRREKEVILDAEKIKKFRCNCGKSGCPIFWKATMPMRPGGKTLLSEAYFAPMKLTHENNRLSEIVNAEYIGIPRYIKELKGCLGTKCLKTSVELWNRDPYVLLKKQVLKPELGEVQPHVPETDELIIIGKTFKNEEVEEVFPEIPKIVVEEVLFNEETANETEAVLKIGNTTLRSSDDEGVTCDVHFVPVRVPETHARGVTLTNSGPIAIAYSWRWRKDAPNPDLPLRFTGNVLHRFHFNKLDGILLPGQSFEHRFWFRSRTPGIFREVWTLVTTPALPEITFVLEAIASKDSSKEDEHINVVETYLKNCIDRTVVHEATMAAVHRAPLSREENIEDYSSKFLEKEIFNEINPLLHYDMDVIREVKNLHNRFFKGPWNFSMNDLCDMLITKVKEENSTIRNEVLTTYCTLYRQLQKKPLIDDFNFKDWEMLKYDLCYMLLCTAVGEMEQCLRYENWRLPKQSKPPGPPEEYSGKMFAEDFDIFSVSFNGNSTEEEEEKLNNEEARLADTLDPEDDEVEDFTFNVGPKIEFDSQQPITLPSRRWHDYTTAQEELRKSGFQKVFTRRESREQKRKQSSIRKDKVIVPAEHEHSPRSASLAEFKPKPKDVFTLHRAFVVLHWKEILRSTIENVAEVIDMINSFRGPQEPSDPRSFERIHNWCNDKMH